MKTTVFLTLLGFCLVSGEKVRYDNYTLFRIQPQSEEQLTFLKNLQETNPELDFWSDPVSIQTFVNIVTAPEHRSEFVEQMKANNIDAVATVEDLQSAFDQQTVTQRYQQRNIRSLTWTNYHLLEDINAWLDDLAEAYPNIVTVVIGGSTFQNRTINGIKISYGSGRRGIFLEGGIHSREWISPSTVTYIINELLHSQNSETRSVAEGFDWYIFPVTNPDGFVFTHESTRMWRKNLRPFSGGVGVDLNRNWNSHWMEKGSSNNPAADTYAGPGPFSEIETRSFSSYIASVASSLDIYLSFHSYSEILLIPYGHTTEPLDNYEEMITIGRRAMGSLSVRYGTLYTTGNIAEAIYEASGGSIDWVKSRFQVPVVALYELRDKGIFGFALPPNQIIRNCEEVMDSLLAIVREARFLGTIN